MGTELNRLLQKYNLSTPSMAQTLGAMGRGNDSLVAHITPREAMMLKAMGGSGTINPRTGLLEFDDGGGDGNGSDGGGDGNSGGGDSDSGGEGNNDGWGGGDWGGNVDFGGFDGWGAFSDPATSQAVADVNAAIAAGYGPEAPNYGYSIDTSQMDSAIAQGLGPESPGWGNLGLDVSDPSNAIAVGYGPESPGWGSPVDSGGGGGGDGYNNAPGNYDGNAYVPPVFTAPPTTTTPSTGGTTPSTGGTTPSTGGTTTGGTTTTPATPGTFQFAAPVSPAFYGFELNRLMRQYGVPAPTIMPYGGAAASTAQTDAAKAAYDQNVYQNYVNEYQNRLANTNMYNMAQFTPNPANFRPQYAAPIANPTYAPANYGGIAGVYSKYFGRQPEQAGVEYWGKTGLTGDALQKAITTGAQNEDLEYLRKNYPNMGFARGGRVGYAEGGEAEDPNSRVVTATPLTPEPPPPAPTPAATVAPTRTQDLGALLSKYAAPSGDYTRELAAARQAARTETEAFSNMIRQMAERGESPTSRAEMYFRLASAFGSPTKTGMFTENLALAGKEMGEYAKGRRTGEAERRGLALKAQELKMAGARQDLATTQALAAQEGSERRAMAREILKEHLASGRPQSDAGKMAQDAGLVPGTPQYNEFVDRYIKTKLESGEMYRQAMLAIQEGNLEIRKMAEARQQDLEKQLTPAELKLKETSEGSLSAARSALRNIEEAIERNRNSFGTSATDRAQYFAFSRAGSTAPRVVNTQQIENLLGRSAIDSLKEKFGAGITNEERRALTELEGALAKTPEERRIILERTRGELQRSIERESNRLRDISSGVYRQRTTPAPTQSGGAQ